MFKNPFKVFRIDVVFFFGFALIVTILVGIVVTVSYINGSRDIADNTSYYQQKLLIELHKKLNTSPDTEKHIYLENTHRNPLPDQLLAERLKCKFMDYGIL